MLGSYVVIIDNERKIDRLVNETEKSEVTINRYGCEVVGYRIQDAARGQSVPLLWRDNQIEAPEKGWKNHAPILFPIVGGLKEKKSLLGDTVISSRGNHGFARHSTFDLVETSHDGRAMIRYRLKPNPEIRQYYPFDFQLDLVYELIGNILAVTFEISNPGRGPILYQFGWHPGFATPVFSGKGSKTDCRILMPKGTITKYENNEHCRLTGNKQEISVGGPLVWTEKELEDTLMFGIDDPEMRHVTLEDPAARVSIRVEFPDFPHLGLWANQGEDYICIEPWQGMDDHEEQETFDKKLGIVKLEPGCSDKRTITVTPRIA